MPSCREIVPPFLVCVLVIASLAVANLSLCLFLAQSVAAAVAVPPPPGAHALFHGVPRHAVAHEKHGDAQRLHVAVAALVVKEQKVFVGDLGAPLQRLHVPQLVGWVDLEAGIKQRDGRNPAAAGVVCTSVSIAPVGTRPLRHPKQLQHRPPQLRCRRAARHAHADACRRQGVQQVRHVAVKGKRLAVLVDHDVDADPDTSAPAPALPAAIASRSFLARRPLATASSTAASAALILIGATTCVSTQNGHSV
ncbi:uncharacterized protein SPSK_03594 [Sporothrix schenckii 1099-18]|uniref:Uncharacterized protein n=1 Tax=Sporothrix schenckii 1099-18 TaxID=1397361 RepID=A0A0F2LZU5_SPOSC|nr:uncharacterized protein SPSK_03594 [Sporothrix schenckii 1099-18]KJR82020.1 hypothetical protein SPSK_03594 [Sporothrix schenckii 1099-18]